MFRDAGGFGAIDVRIATDGGASIEGRAGCNASNAFVSIGASGSAAGRDVFVGGGGKLAALRAGRGVGRRGSGVPPVASAGMRGADAPVGTGGGVGARNADVADVAPGSATVVMAACFWVVSFDASARGGGGGATARTGSTAARSLASSVGIETRSSVGVSTTDDGTDGTFVSAAPIAAGAGAAEEAVSAGFALELDALATVLSAFVGVGDAGAIGAAAVGGAAAFIGSVRPRSGEPAPIVGVAIGFVADAAAIGRAPGMDGENFDGVGRCGDGPGLAGFAGVPESEAFAVVAVVAESDATDGVDTEDSSAPEFPPFAGCDDSPIHRT